MKKHILILFALIAAVFLTGQTCTLPPLGLSCTEDQSGEEDCMSGYVYQCEMVLNNYIWQSTGTVCDDELTVNTTLTEAVDLTVSAVTVDPASPEVDQSTDVTIEITNEGSEDAICDIQLALYDITTGTSEDLAYISMNDYCTSLAGESSVTITIPGLVFDTAGDVELEALVDPYNILGESDRTNNVYVFGFTVVEDAVDLCADVTCNEGYSCDATTGTCVEDAVVELACTDSEETNDYTTYGTITTASGTYEDFCGAGTSLVEQYCTDGVADADIYDCADDGLVCFEGACVEEALCVDSEETNDYYTYGSVTMTGTDDEYYDFCGANNNLVEQYCVDNEYGADVYDCTDEGMVCYEGACVEVVPTTTTVVCEGEEDNGDDPSNYGYAGIQGNTLLYDTCYGSNLLVESYCDDNNYLSAKLYGCDCSSNACTDTATLADVQCEGQSDSGDDPYTYGSAGYQGSEIEDTCNPEANILLESYCDDGDLAIKLYECDCLNGACITSECVDSEETNDYYTYGTITISGETYEDFCGAGNSLVEQYCEDGVAQAEVHDCVGGEICLNGACLNRLAEAVPDVVDATDLVVATVVNNAATTESIATVDTIPVDAQTEVLIKPIGALQVNLYAPTALI